jgi:hypothetical protein
MRFVDPKKHGIKMDIQSRMVAFANCPLYNCPNPGKKNVKKKEIQGFLALTTTR